MPSGGAALRERARAADRGDEHAPLGRRERDGHEAMGGQLDAELDRAVDGDVAAGRGGERAGPDGEDGVGGDDRVAQRARLLGVELLGLVARAGLGEVEVAGNAQQLGGADGRAGDAAAVGDVRLQRAEVAAAVEDHGQGVRQREIGDLQRDGRTGLGVDERALQQVVGVGHVSPLSRSDSW